MTQLSEEKQAFQAGYDARANGLLLNQAQASRDQWLWVADYWDRGYQKAEEDGRGIQAYTMDCFLSMIEDGENPLDFD